MNENDLVKYKIICPTEEDRYELMFAFKQLHDSRVDMNIHSRTVTRLIHEFLDEKTLTRGNNNIVVDETMYNQLIEKEDDTEN